jgi:hypothetical protein
LRHKGDDFDLGRSEAAPAMRGPLAFSSRSGDIGDGGVDGQFRAGASGFRGRVITEALANLLFD